MKWRTANGEVMELSDMTDDHLLNALRYCQRQQMNYKNVMNFFNHPVLGPRGEYATYAAEEEVDRLGEDAAGFTLAEIYLMDEVKKRKLTPYPKPKEAQLPEFELVGDLGYGKLYKVKEQKKGEGKMSSELNLEFFVAGVKHHNLHRCFNEIQLGDIVKMVPEPDNKYDHNAVRLLYESFEKEEDIMIGYVPAKFSAQICAFLEMAEDPTCEIVWFDKAEPPWSQLRVRIYDHHERVSKSKGGESDA